VDEYGQRHESGHHYKIDYWEVLNEVDYEHSMSPETYTRLYDAIVEAIRRVDPEIKFVGLALAGTSPTGTIDTARYFEHFLNRTNHKPGIPLDMISYHFYAVPSADQPTEALQFTFFEQADHFLRMTQYIEKIRERLSPTTQTTINEIGSIAATDFDQGKPGYVFKPLPNFYWNLSAATFAYVFSGLARLGIEVAGESQLVGYPTQYPSVSMLDWTTGQPNARYWVLKLLHDNFGPGDALVETQASIPYVHAQAFVTRDGKQKILLLNKRDRSFELDLAGADGGEMRYVDQTTAFGPPATSKISGNPIPLRGFAVAVVTLPGKP
jgi:hypothetical protein